MRVELKLERAAAAADDDGDAAVAVAAITIIVAITWFLRPRLRCVWSLEDEEWTTGEMGAEW